MTTPPNTSQVITAATSKQNFWMRYTCSSISILKVTVRNKQTLTNKDK